MITITEVDAAKDQKRRRSSGSTGSGAPSAPSIRRASADVHTRLMNTATASTANSPLIPPPSSSATTTAGTVATPVTSPGIHASRQRCAPISSAAGTACSTDSAADAPASAHAVRGSLPSEHGAEPPRACTSTAPSDLDPPRQPVQRQRLPALARPEQLADEARDRAGQPGGRGLHERQRDERDVALAAHLVGPEVAGDDDREHEQLRLRQHAAEQGPEPAADDRGRAGGAEVELGLRQRCAHTPRSTRPRPRPSRGGRSRRRGRRRPARPASAGRPPARRRTPRRQSATRSSTPSRTVMPWQASGVATAGAPAASASSSLFLIPVPLSIGHA